MSVAERFSDIEVESDTLGYKVVGFDDELQKERELFVNYTDVVNFAADAYFDGDKSTAASWLKNVDWLTLQDEIRLLFKHKMSENVL